MKNNLKEKAKKLRSKGYSFREISEVLEISKSTASLWTRNVSLNIEAKNRIHKLGIIGRRKALITIKKKQKEELLKISKNCTVPRMIKIFLWLLRNSFSISELKFRARLHLHNYHNKEDMINFWSKVTGIEKSKFSIYNKSHTGINKKPDYKGCLSVRYKDSKIYKEVFIIVERFVKKFNNAGLV